MHIQNVSLRIHHGCVDWNKKLVDYQSLICSHPSRMRGLKLLYRQHLSGEVLRIHHGCVDWNCKRCPVFANECFASITDAWIETTLCQHCAVSQWFASITDAWIETLGFQQPQTYAASHPSRMRGLKLLMYALLSLNMVRIHHGCVDWNCFRHIHFS